MKKTVRAASGFGSGLSIPGGVLISMNGFWPVEVPFSRTQRVLLNRYRAIAEMRQRKVFADANRSFGLICIGFVTLYAVMVWLAI